MSPGIHTKQYGNVNRRSIRLKGYDYARPGAYFFTICAKDRVCLFGTIKNDEMLLNECGKITDQCWHDLPTHYRNMVLDEWIIMPNHVHGIIIIRDDERNDRAMSMRAGFIGAGSVRAGSVRAGSVRAGSVRAGFKPAPTSANSAATSSAGKPASAAVDKKHGLPEFMRALKTFSARRINEYRNTPGAPVWQRNYYEHIIRNGDELNAIRHYIMNNPANWKTDEDYIKL